MITNPPPFNIEKNIISIIKVRDKFTECTAEDLKFKLRQLITSYNFKKKSSDNRIFTQQLAMLAISTLLSDKGIAPQWQATDNEKTGWYLTMADLYWLHKTFKKHKCGDSKLGTKAWGDLFGKSEFNYDLAFKITRRNMNQAKKVMNLSLSIGQQCGCITMLRDESKDRLKRGKKYKEKLSEKHRTKAVSNKMTIKEIRNYHLEVYYCFGVANKSPSLTASMYGWKTGKTLNKSNVKRTINTIKNKYKK